MNQTDDRAFIRRFSGIIIGLVVVTVVIIVLALSLKVEPDPNANPSKRILAEKRIAPVAAVRIGDEGAVALAEAERASATESVPGDTAGDIDGEQVYNGLCMTCHAASVAGAPKPGSPEMTARLEEKGLETLISNSINGLNVMPPRGGNPALSDDEMRAAVEFMTQ